MDASPVPDAFKGGIEKDFSALPPRGFVMVQPPWPPVYDGWSGASCKAME